MIYSLADGMKPLSSEGKNDLEIGRVLQLNGYNDPKYAIIRKLGIDEKYGYGMQYRMINLETKEESGTSAVNLKFLKEKKGGIQMYITDEILSPEEVLDLYEDAKVQAELKEVAKKEKEDFRARECEELKAKYKDLTLVGPTGKSGRVVGAMNIRIELKKAFPGVKFSVTSESFSMGNAIRISYTDGPTTEAVEKITDKYQEGSFNGMEDIYEYSDEQFPDLFGGAKYVSVSRRVSEAAFNQVAKELGYEAAVFNPRAGGFDGVDYGISDMIKRETYKRTF